MKELPDDDDIHAGNVYGETPPVHESANIEAAEENAPAQPNLLQFLWLLKHLTQRPSENWLTSWQTLILSSCQGWWGWWQIYKLQS